MRGTTLVVIVTIVLSCLPFAARAQDGGATPEKIAPLYRSERHFGAGESYLRALPDGTRVSIERADGSGFDLTLDEGVLRASLPAAKLDDDGATLILPSGYRIYFSSERKHRGIVIEAPSSELTALRWDSLRNTGVGRRSDGLVLTSNYDPWVIRIPDGTRIDAFDKFARWEAVTLAGERFRLDLTKSKAWETLPTLPSPPLIPFDKTFYLAGDGNDWRRGVPEDHVVFAWNWIMVGLSIDRAIADVSEGHRRDDLDRYFNELEYVQPPHELAACILGRRLALGGGDRVTFHRPGAEPESGFIFPGSLPPNYIPVRGELPSSLPLQ